MKVCYLFIDCLHRLGVIPVARRGTRGQDPVDLLELFRRQPDMHGAEVFVEIPGPFRTRYRHDILPLSEDPRKRQPARRAALGHGKLFDRCHKIEVLLKVLTLEPWFVAAEVFRRQVIDRLELSGQESATQRAVGDEPDAQFPHGRQDLGLGLAAPERILRLQRGDRVNHCGSTDRCGCSLRQPEVTHFSSLHQVRHRPDRLLDWRVGIDPVLVVKVDHIDAQSLEAGVTALPDILRITPDAEEFTVRAADVAELRRQYHLPSAVLDGLADEDLVSSHSIDVRRVEQVPASVQVTMDDADRLRVIHLLRVVELAHPHAAEADRGYAKTTLAKCTLDHGVSPWLSVGTHFPGNTPRRPGNPMDLPGAGGLEYTLCTYRVT